MAIHDAGETLTASSAEVVGPLRSALGITSIGFGALSIVTVPVAQYWESLRGTASAYLLNTADRLGLIRQPHPFAEVELRPSGLLPMTDETALWAFLVYGVYLGLVSVVLSLWAEYRREDNLYLSAGFICGVGGVFLANKDAGLAVAMIGAVAVFLLRHVRQSSVDRA
jgi:hypothetical protein